MKSYTMSMSDSEETGRAASTMMDDIGTRLDEAVAMAEQNAVLGGVHEQAQSKGEKIFHLDMSIADIEGALQRQAFPS